MSNSIRLQIDHVWNTFTSVLHMLMIFICFTALAVFLERCGCRAWDILGHFARLKSLRAMYLHMQISFLVSHTSSLIKYMLPSDFCQRGEAGSTLGVVQVFVDLDCYWVSSVFDCQLQRANMDLIQPWQLSQSTQRPNILDDKKWGKKFWIGPWWLAALRVINSGPSAM